MKKIIFTLFAFGLVYFQLSAQYCGDSGPLICTPNVTADTPGLYPTPYCLTPVYVDSEENFTVGFQNFDMAFVLGAEQTIDSLKLDTINNLPQGLCWATNSASNTYYTNEQGCIQISGRVADTVTPGQYRINIVATVWLAAYEPTGLTVNASIEGLYYYLRVKSSPADLCPRLIDTTGQAAGANIFIPYTGSCDIGTGYVACGDLPYTVQLTDLISPKPVECDTLISPLFLIINNGINTLTSDSIIYIYDSGTPGVYVWTGGLATGEEAHISLPSTSLTTGNHTLLIISRSPDGQPDGDPVEDTLSLSFSVGQSPVVAITSSSTQCSADTLDAGNPGSSYLWSDSETTEKILAYSSGTYWVTVTTAQQCPASGSYIVISPLPDAQIAVSPAAICEGQSATLTASGGTHYAWSDSLGTNTQVSVSPANTTSYMVTVTNADNCTATAVNSLTVYSLPAQQTISGNTTATTNLQYTYTVSSVGGDTYNWSVQGGTIQSGQGTNSITVTWGPPGNHSVTMIESNGDACTDTSTLDVTVVTGINDLNTANASIGCDYMDGNNLLRITFSSPTRYSLKLYEISGSVVFEVPGTENMEIMVPGNLAKGIYIAEVNTGGISLRKKVWVR